MTEEDFLNSIYEQIPKNLSPLSIVMSCYIELGKRSNYMAEYFIAGENGDDYTQYNIYHSKKFIFENEKNIVICTSLCRQLQELLNRFNISSEIVIDKRNTFALQDGLPHVFTIVHLPEYSFKIDLTKDLYRIHLGNKLRHFGSNPVDESNPYKTFSQAELYDILKELNYLNSKGDYSNEAWIALRNTISSYGDIDPKEKLEFILREPLRFSVFSNLGPVERFHFYSSLFNNMPEQTWTN